MESEKSENSPLMYRLKWFDIWALGITIVIGGQYFSWNYGLESGFGSFMISTLLMGFAYICLCLCTSEMSSAIPFAGGAYGLARCTLGFFPGFLIGASEAIEYIFYVSASITFLVNLLCSLNNELIGYEPIVWLLFYVTACLIYIYGGIWFWRFNMFLAVTSIIILLFYCFGSMAFANLFLNGQYQNVKNGWFVGGASSFMLTFPLAAWFYVGVESLNMASDDIEEPKQNIPKGQISCILTLFVTSMLTLIVTAALPPGIEELSTTSYPLNNGVSLIFNTTSDMVLILSIPATFATTFGFIYAYSKMISAMSLSKLWPQQLGVSYSKTGAPYGGILAGSLLSYLTCIAAYYNTAFALTLFNICILAAFVAYSSQCVGYIALQTRYSNLPREFKSPLGIPGAVFSLCVWVLGIICVVFFQEDNYLAVSIYAGIIGVLSLYYFVYAGKRQTISEQERSVLFVAHVVNNSNNKRRKRRKSISDEFLSKIGLSFVIHIPRRISSHISRYSRHPREGNVSHYHSAQAEFSIVEMIASSIKTARRGSASMSSMASLLEANTHQTPAGAQDEYNMSVVVEEPQPSQSNAAAAVIYEETHEELKNDENEEKEDDDEKLLNNTLSESYKRSRKLTYKTLSPSNRRFSLLSTNTGSSSISNNKIVPVSTDEHSPA